MDLKSQSQDVESEDDQLSHISRKGVESRCAKRLNSCKMTAEVGSVAFMAPELLEYWFYRKYIENKNDETYGVGNFKLLLVPGEWIKDKKKRTKKSIEKSMVNWMQKSLKSKQRLWKCQKQ